MITFKKNYIPIFLIISLILLLFLIVFSVLLGTADISSSNVFSIIGEKIFNIHSNLDDSKKFIILNLRMPRILLSILVGGALSLAGCGLQAVFKNPMADPYITGTSAGALFGGALSILIFEEQNISLAVASFMGSLIATFTIYTFAQKNGRVSITTMLLGGLVLSSFLGALVQLIMIYSKQELINILTFTMGSFSGATWTAVKIMSLVLILTITVYFKHYKELNIMSLGDENAESIGVNADRTKKLFLVLSALLTATAVSFSGVIGFIGLIIPHFFRLIFGNNHKYLIPFSLIGGAFLMLLCDNVARATLESSEFPVGVVTSIIGAPVFLALLKKSRGL